MLTPVFEEAGKQIENDFPVCILYHYLLLWYNVMVYHCENVTKLSTICEIILLLF